MLPILEMWMVKNRLLEDVLLLKHFWWTFKPQRRCDGHMTQLNTTQSGSHKVSESNKTKQKQQN